MRRLLAVALAVVLLAVSASPVAAHNGINRRTNDFRAAHGLNRLWTTHNLERLAHRRAVQIATNFEHDFWWWGRTRCDGVGENIAMRKPATEPGTRAAWFVNAWIDSPGHRQLMLGTWHRMASGIYLSPDGAMWGVEIFCWEKH